jgi:O-antigen/teichoic acid export membrane protein
MTDEITSSSLSLKSRLLSATVWNLAGYGVTQFIRFFSNLLFARLLTPDAFGLLAIASIVVVGLTMFSDLGLKQNIIRRQGLLTDRFVNTAWVVQILRGALLWLGAVWAALAIWIANRFGLFRLDSVYANPDLVPITIAFAFIALLMGFETTKSAEAARNLAISKITQIEIVSQLVGLFVMIGLAIYTRSAWILVAGGVSSTLCSVLLGHFWLSGIGNRFRWDSPSFREILHFGKWIFAASLLSFLALNGDRLLLGWLLGSTDFGVYVVAFLLFSVGEQVFSRFTAGVIFPGLSEIVRHSPSRLKAQYYRMHFWPAVSAYAIAGVLFSSSDALVHTLYDHRYDQAGWILGILASSFVMAPFSLSIQCYTALGRPELTSLVALVRLLCLLTGVPLGFYAFGFFGAVCGVALSRLLCLPIILFNNIKAGIFNLWRELLPLPAIIVGMLSGFVISRTLIGW